MWVHLRSRPRRTCSAHAPRPVFGEGPIPTQPTAVRVVRARGAPRREQPPLGARQCRCSVLQSQMLLTRRQKVGTRAPRRAAPRAALPDNPMVFFFEPRGGALKGGEREVRRGGRGSRGEGREGRVWDQAASPRGDAAASQTHNAAHGGQRQDENGMRHLQGDEATRQHTPRVAEHKARRRRKHGRPRGTDCACAPALGPGRDAGGACPGINPWGQALGCRPPRSAPCRATACPGEKATRRRATLRLLPPPLAACAERAPDILTQSIGLRTLVACIHQHRWTFFNRSVLTHPSIERARRFRGWVLFFIWV